jgi:hypothetical protein
MVCPQAQTNATIDMDRPVITLRRFIARIIHLHIAAPALHVAVWRTLDMTRSRISFRMETMTEFIALAGRSIFVVTCVG